MWAGVAKGSESGRSSLGAMVFEAGVVVQGDVTVAIWRGQGESRAERLCLSGAQRPRSLQAV